MKKSILLVMSVMLVTLTGCDFLRRVAGRPTSEDIQEKRVIILKAEEEALQERLDSIRRENERRVADSLMVADSLAAVDSLASWGIVTNGPGRLGGLSDMELSSRYYIIAGAFREGANAKKIFDAAYERGCSPVLIGCRNGMVAVGICPADRIAVVRDSLMSLKGESFLPKDAWILKNE